MNQIKEKSITIGKKEGLYEFLFQAKCPNCGKHLPYSIIRKYFWHNVLYYSNCNHCGQPIHPIKEPISVFKCVCFGGMSTMIPMYTYWYCIAWDFIPALLCALPFVIITLIVIGIITMHNIKFTI